MNRPPLLLLIVASAMLPLLGGQVYVGAQPLNSGGLLPSLREPSLAFTAHALLGILVIVALAWMMLKHRIVQVPSPTLYGLLIGVIGTGLLSIGFSAFPWLSWLHGLEWSLYGAFFLAAIAISGREKGPKAILWALVGGTTWVSIEAILEYSAMRSVDPNWRVFGGWVNPNALAGMLVLALFIALALTTEEERLHKLLAGVAAFLIGFALVLTQSRGGILAAGLGFTIWLLLMGLRKEGRALVPSLAVVLLLAVAMGARQASPGSTTPAASAITRAAQSSGTQEHSAGFRQLLWQGAIKMAAERPVGYGLGTYRFESGRSELTPQTQFTHQGFLQSLVETGWAGFIFLIGFLGVWIKTVLTGFRKLESARASLLAGVVAAWGACMGHNLFDSDFQHFGIGAAAFLIMGIGIQLAADGSTPEFMTKQLKAPFVATVASLSLLFLAHGITVEWSRAGAYAAAQQGDAAKAATLARQAVSLSPSEGDALALLASLPGGGGVESWERAVMAAPTTRNLRALARARRDAGDLSGAQGALEEALRRDPLNLPTRLLLVQYSLERGDRDLALETTRKMIASESSPYFRVRPLPELIPTETYEARLAVAPIVPDDEERNRWRLEAIQGIAEYVRVTGPQIRRMDQAGIREGFAGETMDDLNRKRALAEANLMILREDYREATRPTKELDALAEVLAGA